MELDRKKLSELLLQLQGEESQRWLAARLAVSPYSLNGWIRGGITPNTENLEKIAEYTGESLDALLARLGCERRTTPADFPTTAEGLIAHLNQYLSRQERLRLLRLLVTQDC